MQVDNIRLERFIHILCITKAQLYGFLYICALMGDNYKTFLLIMAL